LRSGHGNRIRHCHQICLIFLAAAQPKGVVTAKYIARLCVRIVIVSQNYRAAFVKVRACYVENDKQIIAEHEHEVWQKSSNMFTSFASKSTVKKKQQFLYLHDRGTQAWQRRDGACA
jgi:hypothetical protein